ncbi:hypothetical protein G6F45_014264 [Rhizopus arrhizus]|nr:hypothetical protein G6F45_014264 [Rhizopus arrhizus]
MRDTHRPSSGCPTCCAVLDALKATEWVIWSSVSSSCRVTGGGAPVSSDGASAALKPAGVTRSHASPSWR